jgi:GNAT superfamily N-acetyltransferase
MTSLLDFPTIESLGDRIGGTIERQFETFCRTLLSGPGVINEKGFFRIITGEMHPLGNFAVVSDPSDVDQTHAATRPLCVDDTPAATLFVGAVGDEVEVFLRERGFVLAETMPAMAVDLDRVTLPLLPDGYAIREVHAGADNASWCETFAVGYGLPRPVADAFGPNAAAKIEGDSVARFFAVTGSGGMVATSTLFLEGGLAGIYCVATLPDERGKGLGACVTAEPLRLARQLGYRTGILQSSAIGESVYRRLGFTGFGTLPLYVRTPTPDASNTTH